MCRMKPNADSMKADLLSGLVVFLVALPLCLGIALASGAPLFAGLISGVVGGIVVGYLSNSPISVSGPAAGLAAIILTSIAALGSFETFLLAVVLAGLMQVAMGYAKAGVFSSYLPSNVIEGMLAGIGVIIFTKQLPYTTSSPGATFIALASLAILIAWNTVPLLKNQKMLPGALAAVATGVAINETFKATGSGLALPQQYLVSLPVPATWADFLAQLTRPDFSAIGDSKVWVTAATIAAVASVETLLCIEAADKMDPLKRYTDTNNELKAQGIGNVVCGLLGGLPVTSVIVRTTANATSGAKTKLSTIAHGALLLIAILAIPGLLNKIPLACLAAVLLMIGYKLAGPAVFQRMWKNGKFQFIPFAVTVVAIVATDLLKGVAIGLAASVLFILHGNMKLAYVFKKTDHHEGETINIELAQEVSFLNKAAIKRVLADLPAGSRVDIDASRTVYIDHDVLEMIRDFLRSGSAEKGIHVRLLGFKKAYRIDDARHVTSHAARDISDVRGGPRTETTPA